MSRNKYASIVEAYMSSTMDVHCSGLPAFDGAAKVFWIPPLQCVFVVMFLGETTM